MIKIRKFKEAVLSKSNEDYLKFVAVYYLDGNKDYKEKLEFISQYVDITKEELEKEFFKIVKSIPDFNSSYNRNIREFENYFVFFQDLVGEDYDKLYDMQKNKRLKASKVISDYYNLMSSSNLGSNFMKDKYFKFIKGQNQSDIKVGSFIIPKEIAHLYKITGNFTNINRWEAKIVIGNSLGSGQQVGDWDGINYIMIPDKTNIIIPIAMGDEHQIGYEALYDYFYKKKLVPKDNYISISKGFNAIYDIENQKDLNLYLQAYTNWIKNKGEDSELVIISRGKWRGKISSFLDTFTGKNFEEFSRILSGEPEEVVITKEGKKFVNLIEQFYRDFKKRNYDFAFNSAFALLQISKKLLNRSDYSKLENEYFNIEARQDTSKLEDFVLGFNGIKNIIHNLIRKKDRTIEDFFGSLQGANEEFIKLSNL